MTSGSRSKSEERAQNDAGWDVQASSTPPLDPIFHFQAWYVNGEPVSECFRDNDDLANLIRSSVPEYFTQTLDVVPSQPKLTQSTVVPVSVQIRKKRNTSEDQNQVVNLLTSFRDHQYPDIVKKVCRDLRKRLAFGHMYATAASGEKLDPYTKVMIFHVEAKDIHAFIELPREEDWLDIASSLAKGVPQSVWRVALDHWERYSSHDSDENNEQAKDGRTLGTGQTSKSKPLKGSKDGRVLYVSLRNYVEAGLDIIRLATTGDNSALVDATRRVACPSDLFKSRFANANQSIISAMDSGAQPGAIWGALGHLSKLRHATRSLINTINSVELPSKFEEKHSATRTTGWGMTAVATGGVAFYGASLILCPGFTASWWFAGWVTSHVWISSAVSVGSGIVSGGSTWKCYTLKSARKKCRNIKVDMESFRESCVKLQRSLALCFAHSLGYDLALKRDASAKNAFLAKFGVDPDSLEEQEYMPEHVRQAREDLKKVYDELMEGIEWLLTNNAVRSTTLTS